ncbi:hypothetical protein ACFLZ4_01675 [Patescibacteria group bacterium]
MQKNNKQKDLLTILLLLISIGGDFVLQGLIGEYFLILVLILWVFLDIKFDLNPIVFMIVSFVLFISEIFLIFNGLEWFVQRTATWIFFIFIFIIFCQIRKLKRFKRQS